MRPVPVYVRDDNNALQFGRRKQLIIRNRGKCRLQKGAFIRLYRRTQRFVSQRPLRNAECVEVLDIHINSSNNTVILNNQLLDRAACHQLALDDGFNDFGEFIRFFKNNGGLPLDGQLVRWL